MDYMKLFKEYGVPAIIIVALLTLLPPYLTPIMGSIAGQYTTYLVAALIVVLALFLNKKAQKQLG